MLAATWRAFVCTAALVTLTSLVVRAERLPIKTFTTADGLAHNVVNRIVRDSHGFLWFCTREGLSRFDGSTFTTYGIADGLPSAVINDVLQAGDDTYWIATGRGVVHFDPVGSRSPTSEGPVGASRPMFTTYVPPGDAGAQAVLMVRQGHEGAVWVGTAHGLFQVAVSDQQAVTLEAVSGIQGTAISSLALDRSGALWVGTMSGLYHRFPDGRVETYRIHGGFPQAVLCLFFEDAERLWVGTRENGLVRLALDPLSGRATVERRYGTRDGLPSTWISQMIRTEDGRLWAATIGGLVQFLPDVDGRDYTFRAFSRPHGLPHEEVQTIAEDGHHNLWVGTSAGAAKVLQDGPVVFGADDGLSWALSIAETKSGETLVIGGPTDRWFVNRFEGAAFVAARHPRFGDLRSWAWNQGLLIDHEGDWWIATRSGVLRFRGVDQMQKLARAVPVATYARRDGLAADVVIRLFEDSRGDVWIATVGEGRYPHGLSRWARRTGTLQHYGDGDGLPSQSQYYVAAFAEDLAGNVWIGLSGDAGLLRYSKGRFRRFAALEGGPSGPVRNLFVDVAGRLWVATYGAGLGRVDAPTIDRPVFTWYTTEEALSSNEVGAVGDDASGRIYVGTARGIDQLDAMTGRITRRYSIRDGLPASEPQAALRDRHGALWFSYLTGLARLVPTVDAPRATPPIIISRLRINGEAQPMSELGQQELLPLELAADRNHLEIEFHSIGYGLVDEVRYQFTLEGADETWSAPSRQPSVTYARLAPGQYRFLVRAVTVDGLASAAPASVAFTIFPPLWQRWWFLSLIAVIVSGLVYAVHRYRVSRLLAVAQMRARIATDLHDDIGANLTTIAVLSEVARQQSPDHDAPVHAPLASIATVARESIASMADIVWAIHPDRDRVIDLARRMRTYAEEVGAAHGLSVSLEALDSGGDDKLGVDVRRDLFLIFKEAVNNAARHAGCTTIRTALRVEAARLTLEVFDDGAGFDLKAERDGTGLVSMQRRAHRLAARFEIVSAVGGGTTVRVVLPVPGSLARRLRPYRKW